MGQPERSTPLPLAETPAATEARIYDLDPNRRSSPAALDTTEAAAHHEQEVSEYLLDQRQADMLFKHFENGDDQAREKLVEGFMPLAKALARRYGGRAEPYEDVCQAAYIGLLNAVDRYDRSRGIKFSTYASPTILGEIKRHFRDHSWAMHVPRSLQDRGLSVFKAMDEIQAKGEKITNENIAKQLGISKYDVTEAITAFNQGKWPESLDKPFNASDDEECDLSAGDVLAGEEEPVADQAIYSAEVQGILSRTDKRGQEILLRLVALRQSQTETARALGISQMHVSRIFRRILKSYEEAAESAEAA